MMDYGDHCNINLPEHYGVLEDDSAVFITFV